MGEGKEKLSQWRFSVYHAILVPMRERCFLRKKNPVSGLYNFHHSSSGLGDRTELQREGG